MGNNFNISGVWQSLSDLWIPIALAVAGIIIVALLIRFIIKKKWAGVVATVVVAVLVAGGGIIYRLPHTLSNIEAEEISKIEVANVEVTDPELIQDILDELNGSKYKRALPSGIGGREKYSVDIYDKNGGVELSLESQMSLWLIRGPFGKSVKTGNWIYLCFKRFQRRCWQNEKDNRICAVTMYGTFLYRMPV